MNPFERYLPSLDKEMQRAVSLPDHEPQQLYKMLHYHLGWLDVDFTPANIYAGKRLRPIFLLLACEAHGGKWRLALPAAVAVELIHNFSLIHDDIEDRDTVRRGRATLWPLWGEAQAINAGDALFTLAFQAIGNLDVAHFPAERILRALKSFTKGILRLTEGQCMDIGFETQVHVTEAAYLDMIAGKTATLIALSCELGGIIAGASATSVAALYDFGHALGMAFQMEDDLLGLWGDPQRIGKPVGADLRRAKKSLPILHGIQHSPELVALLSETTHWDDAGVERALTLMENMGSKTYAQEQARRYHQQALVALTRTQGNGAAQQALYDLAQNLLNRDK